MKRLIFSFVLTLLTLGILWASAAQAETLEEMQKSSSMWYGGSVVGATHTLVSFDILRCPENTITGTMIIGTLAIHPDWAKEEFPTAVAKAMVASGCKVNMELATFFEAQDKTAVKADQQKKGY